MNSKITWSTYFLICLTSIIFIFSSCGSSDPRVEFKKEPLDEIIKDYSSNTDFSIILHDMDFNEGRNAYVHQYKILYAPVGKDTLLEKVTGWKDVSDVFFDKNKENMGMEIASKKDGVVKKIASPPGYSNYVGNEKYGHWKQNSSGGSFWEFYGKYAFMSSMFRMMTYPVGYSYWNNYRSNYYSYGRPYYGSGNDGRNRYGSGSRYNSENNKNSKWNSRSSNFKNKVRSRVQRSATTTKQNRAKARSRSNSRYRSSSNYRSRGGGFGK